MKQRTAGEIELVSREITDDARKKKKQIKKAFLEKHVENAKDTVISHMRNILSGRESKSYVYVESLLTLTEAFLNVDEDKYLLSVFIKSIMELVKEDVVELIKVCPEAQSSSDQKAIIGFSGVCFTEDFLEKLSLEDNTPVSDEINEEDAQVEEGKPASNVEVDLSPEETEPIAEPTAKGDETSSE